MQRIKRTGFLLLLVLLLTACGKSVAEQVQEQLDLGNKYLEELNYEQAIVAFEKVIELESKEIRAYTGLISAYMGAGNEAEAGNVAADGTELFVTADTIAEDEYLYDFLECTVDYHKESSGILDACDYWIKALDNLQREDEKLAFLDDIEANLLKDCLKEANTNLEKMDYEQAAAMFTKVVDLEGQNADAYAGLEKIYKLTGDLESLLNLAELYQTKGGAELPDFLKKIQVSKEVIYQIIGLCEEGEQDAVFEIMQGEDYQNLEVLAEELGTALILAEGEKGFGLYPANSEIYGDFMLYYGDYQNDLRHGQGMWMAYKDGNNYCALGDWKNDMPNGEQYVRDWNSRMAQEVTTRVVSGTVADGLWNGPAQWGFEETDGTGLYFDVSFTNGKWVVLEVRTDEDGLWYRVSEEADSGEGSLGTTDPDELNGIEGFL